MFKQERSSLSPQESHLKETKTCTSISIYSHSCFTVEIASITFYLIIFLELEMGDFKNVISLY